jgi:hypothetical protein
VEALHAAELVDAPAEAGEPRAPLPDFRYVGLEPVRPPRPPMAAAGVGLSTGLALGAAGADASQVLACGVVSAAVAALVLRALAAARARVHGAGNARMAVVPWGVLIEKDETPRILRWAAVRRIDVVHGEALEFAFARARTSRVVVETSQERFEGEARGPAPLDGLVTHLEAYAIEQAAPLALGLGRPGATGDVSVEPAEPFFEPLLSAANEFLRGGAGASRLGLGSGTYRKASLPLPTETAIETLRAVLAGRHRSAQDARAFAAVVAAELGAHALCRELVALTQSPHPFVAAVAKQAARKLGVPRARTGTLDEVAPFLWESDRARLEAWLAHAPAAR